MTLQKIEIDARTALEIGHHEAILLQAYKDSRKVWTWSVGITSASGHNVERYIDRPSTLDEALAVWVWLMQTKYAPDVLKAFEGYELTREQFTAALSFHWNTGKIAEARDAFMWYNQPKEIIPRRKAEAALFFDGVWSGDGKISLIQKVNTKYQPVWSSTKKIDITEQLTKLLKPAEHTALPEGYETKLQALTASPVAEVPQVVTPAKQSYNPPSIWMRLNLWLIKVFG